MNKSKFHLELREILSCTKIRTEAKKGSGQRNSKVAANDCFIFNIWFASKRWAEATMDVGAYIIGMVKTNTKI